MFGFVFGFLSGSIRYFHLTAFLDFTVALDVLDFILLNQELNPFAHFICYAAASFDDGVKLMGAAGLYSKVLGMFDVFIHLCALEQSLGGYATPIEANATEALFFDDSGF